MIIRFLNRILLAILAGCIIYRITEINIPMALAMVVILIIITGR